MPLSKLEKTNNTELIIYTVSWLTLFAAFFYNLTPFIGVDCWWHMKFGEYFVLNHSPVWHDPFAIQGEKIISTYPDLIPGVLFYYVYKFYSFIGLNLLRIGLFTSFVAFLVFLSSRSNNVFQLLFFVSLIVLGINSRVILQPDLFNYLYFSLWVYFLLKLKFDDKWNFGEFIPIILVEIFWVNSHPLFFYHGVFFAAIFLLIHLDPKIFSGKLSTGNKSRNFSILLSAFIIGFLWIFVNPLGIYAFDSLLINMLKPGFVPYSCESFVQSLSYINTYSFLLIFLLMIANKPWSADIPRREKFIHLAMLVILLIPALRYERCLPYPVIYLIILAVVQPKWFPSPSLQKNNIYLALSVAAALFLITDRAYLYSPSLFARSGMKYSYTNFKGLGFADINEEEPIRETAIINQLVGPGNCATNTLSIASTAVWHCPDKPFFMHGHAAVINARVDRLRAFISNLTNPLSHAFMEKHGIETVIMTETTDTYLEYPKDFSENFVLIYLDPYMSVFRRRGTMTAGQKQRLANFYGSFVPGRLDSQKFNREDQIKQYLLLWFSAEMTGNNGDHYLEMAKRTSSTDYISKVINKLRPLVADGQIIQ